MTYFSAWIERLPPGQSDPDPSVHNPNKDVFKSGLSGDLQRPGILVGPLRDWANTQGAPIRGFDNCFIRVEVSAEQLRHFLRNGSELGQECIEAIERDIISADRYVIVAEEF